MAEFRILDLDPIADETISLSQELAIDDATQTFKINLLQMREFFNNINFPLGSYLIRDTNPGDNGYPGVWSKVGAQTVLSTGIGDDSDLGTTTGENSPNVPLPEHRHSASFRGNALPGHAHDILQRFAGSPGVSVNWMAGDNGGIIPKIKSDSVSAGTPSGNVSVNSSGEANATINVQGKREIVNIWKRTGE